MAKQIWKGSTLLAPVPPTLVSCGTVEQPNVLTVAWAGVINTQPPRVGISIRPERHSYGLIKESGEFVINLPTVPLLRAVDWCGVRSGRDYDKFREMGLTAAAASAVSAPLVEESPLNLECKVFQVIPLGSHDLFLADVAAIQVDESLVDSTGKLRLDKANLLAYAHGQYFSLGDVLGTFGYSVRKKPAKRRPSRKPHPRQKG